MVERDEKPKHRGIPRNLIRLRAWGSASFLAGLLSLLAAHGARATEFFYPGSFDPFHLSHYEEVLASVAEVPGASVRILPIEQGYYNVRDGLYDPRFFPYDLSLQLIRDSFTAYPDVTVSDDLRHIDSNIFQTLQSELDRSADPDKRLVIGVDILEAWSKTPGFDLFRSKVKLVVGLDPKNLELDNRLKKEFENDPQVSFLDFDHRGIRSNDVVDRMFNDPKGALEQLTPGFRAYFEKNPAKLSEILWSFRRRVEDYVAQRTTSEILPLLKNAGFNRKSLQIMRGNSAFLVALATATPDDASLNRLVDRFEAIMSLEGPIDRPGSLIKFRELLKSAHFRALPSQPDFSYLRDMQSRFNIPRIPAPVVQPKLAPPAYLFHWTSHSKMQRMAKLNPDPERFPQRFIKSYQLVTVQHPQLAGLPGLFAWSNPLNGMAASPEELYAWKEKGYAARLLAAKIKPDASVIEIRTDIGAPPRNIPGLENYDLILNRAFNEQGRPAYSEWIILNPDAVQDFTADPERIRPLIEAELRKLKNPAFHYAPEEMFSDFEDRTLWRNIAKGYLAGGTRGIPQALLRNMKTPEINNLEGCAATALTQILKKTQEKAEKVR